MLRDHPQETTENSVDLARPALAAGDGPIGLYRRWAGQFYEPVAVDELRAGDARRRVQRPRRR